MRLINKAWKLLPAMAVHMGERFKHAPIQTELTRLVRTDSRAVINVPEALHFLLGSKLEAGLQRALQVGDSNGKEPFAEHVFSGFLSGRRCHPSPLLFIFNLGTAIIRLFCNTPCGCWNNIQ